MDFARHQALLNVPAKDGKPQRVHLQVAADRGSTSAQAALDGPPFPEDLADLWGHFTALDHARPEGFAQVAPLTHVQVDAYARLMGWTPEPHEVQALFLLDVVTRFPEAA